MGKYSTGWLGGKDHDPDEAKRKLRIKDLDQIRKNALVRKRDLRSKESFILQPKSGFIKTLNQFASQRRKIEEATQITSGLINNKPKIVKQEVLHPKNVRGFLREGVKSKELYRPLDPEFEKFKNGVLHSDVLQILQSGHPCHSRIEEKQQPSKSTKSPIEDDHADLKMEVAKILNNCNSSESSSFDLDNPGVIEFPSSPVIGRYKGAKKKNNQVKAPINEKKKSLHSQENENSLINNINKGERYRRRLFDEAAAGVNNRHKEVPKNVQRNNQASINSTPENVIFYSKVISKEPVNKTQKQPTLEPTDPIVIKSYIEICKFAAASQLKNMFRDKYKDPEEKAREALKLTYKKTVKDSLHRQNCQSKSADETTPSSNSEILLEPDSDIARMVKKNIAFLKEKESTTTPSNSTDSTKNFVNKVNARSLANTVENNVMKRKYAPSSKGSETEVPSSTQAIADPKSVVRANLKMNNIHPDRQELVARFLEDQKSFISEASQEPQERLVQKEKLYIDSNSKSTYYVQKSTKYIPAILRKNRSLADCIAKEKATIFSVENYPSQRNKKSSIIDLDNVESERTPNTITEPLLEAPKSKYNHMNAKYNQPSRINIPLVQDNRNHRNPAPERHSQRFASPNSVQKNFILSQTYNLSPIKQHQSYSQDTSHDFRFCQLSQDGMDNGNRMTRMVSFGDIQDRTNRLTICSQNQNCSQEKMEHAYASQRSHPSCHYQPCEPTNNCNPYKNQPHVPFVKPSFDRSNCDCSSALHCVDRPHYVPQNEYQKIPQSEYSYHESNTCSCCHQPNSMETLNKCVMPARQPIKYHATDGNRRQPIYNPNESCSFSHKQPCCSTSRAESSDFEYLDMLKMNYGGGGDRPQSHAPPNGNQRYIVQRQIPASPPPPPVVCQQAAAYRHNRRNANEACKMNDAYLHQMNRQMHSKRQ